MTDETLFFACRDFVAVRFGGEWSDEQISEDARKMAEFIERIRPARVKLNTDVTPEIVAMLDGSAAREDEARWAADWALKIGNEEMRAGTRQHAMGELVTLALGTLAYARKQVAQAQTKG